MMSETKALQGRHFYRGQHLAHGKLDTGSPSFKRLLMEADIVTDPIREPQKTSLS